MIEYIFDHWWGRLGSVILPLFLFYLIGGFRWLNKMADEEAKRLLRERPWDK